MRQTRPLPDTYPELTVFHRPEFTEYRVEHWRLARDGSGRVLRGACVWSFLDVGFVFAMLVVGSAVFFAHVCDITGYDAVGKFGIAHAYPRPLLLGIGTSLVYLLWSNCTQVLYESILVFPTLGIQLETHRGHPALPHRPLTTTRRFIPLSALEDVVLHEGFRRWNVRYYLAALYRTGRGTFHADTDGDSDTGAGVDSGLGTVRVCVAFENILPYFPVLKEVYLGIQQELFPPSAHVVVDCEVGEASDTDTEVEKEPNMGNDEQYVTGDVDHGG